MDKRVCVFVDGENFRHTIVDLFVGSFKQEDYLPKTDWEKLFDWFVQEAIGNSERIRTYWYVTESIDFFPYHFPFADTEPDKLRKVLAKDRKIRNILDSVQEDALVAKMNHIRNGLVNRKNQMVSRFNGWVAVQNGISSQNRSIEFRRAGAINYNLFYKRFGSEKAVDVKLGIDLIVLKDTYDAAVIVSGDQDFVPAVQVVKDYGKHVINVSFRRRGGRLLPGGARRLNQATDWPLIIDYQNFAQQLGIQP